MGSRKETWVSKFGGTSLANYRQIEKVKNIVLSDPRRKIIVVSAPGKEHGEDEKITDLLYSCHRLCASGKSFDKPFEIIRSRFLEIAEHLQVGKTVKDELQEIYERIPEETEPDYAASRGEYLNGKMFAEYIGAEFVDAQDVLFLTADGQVDETSYGKTAEAFSDPQRLYVLPGFYGTNPEGRIMCFSRGGSDISGAVAARALRADLYENWTDVSGILMADPRIVPDAKVVREITYREIRELASIGANVFHEEAIAPVRKVGIPIQIKNTNDPDAPGTSIVSYRNIDDCPVVGVSGKKPYRRVIIEKFMLNRYPDFSEMTAKLLNEAGLKSDVTISGFDAVTLYIDTKLFEDVEEIQERILVELEADACAVSEPLALIGIVGEGTAVEAGLLNQILFVLQSFGISPVSVTSGISPLSMLISVPVDQYEHTVSVLAHEAALQRSYL